MYNTKSKPYDKLRTLGGDDDVSVYVRQLWQLYHLAGTLIAGEAVPELGQGVSGKFLYFLLHFAVNLKLL